MYAVKTLGPTTGLLDPRERQWDRYGGTCGLKHTSSIELVSRLWVASCDGLVPFLAALSPPLIFYYIIYTTLFTISSRKQ